MVINRDDAQVEALVPMPEVAKAGAFGKKGRKATTLERRVARFGIGAPTRPGDFGLIDENGMTWLVRARERDETLQRSRGGKGTPTDAEELLIQRLMPADALRVRGRHNAANALAALALATAIDCPLAPMLHGLREYAGEPHRVAYVAALVRGRRLRRQQGHERRRDRRRAERAGRRQGAGEAGRDPRWRRQGTGLRAARRAGASPCARGRDDRARRAGDRGRARHHRRPDAAFRDPAGGDALELRARPRRRRGAAEPGLREPGHVPQLSGIAPRCSWPRCMRSSPTTEGSPREPCHAERLRRTARTHGRAVAPR